MNWDLIVKLGGLAVAVISAGKLLYDLMLGQAGRLREEYKFAKEFLQEVAQNKDLHPYAKEKGFQAIAGDSNITGIEIEYLLSLQSPVKALRNYVLGKKYLQHLPKAGNLQIAFKEKYQSTWARRWRKIYYLSLYTLFASLSLAPWIFAKFLFEKPDQGWAMILLCPILFAPFAWFCLKDAARIFRAEDLVAEQGRHVQRIILSPGVLEKP